MNKTLFGPTANPRSRAYLVLWIDDVEIPPRVLDAGIYSEASPTCIAGGGSPIPVIEVESSSYSKAREKIVQAVEGNALYAFLNRTRTYTAQRKSDKEMFGR